MTQRQRELLNQLDSTVEEALEAFLKGITPASTALLESVNELILSLKKRSGGSVFGSAANYEQIRRYSKEFSKHLGRSGYPDLVKGLLASYNRLAGVIDDYFRTLSPGYARKQAYHQILKANIETTVQSLLASGIEANFKEPVIKLLKVNIAGGTEARALQNLLREEILGNPEKLGRLERYTAQVTQDSIEQFGRNYIEGVSADLGLKHYLYAGSRIGDTRDFCCGRAGRYFTEDEVRDWGNLKWSGQIGGTNSSNIKTYLGGWNCKHRLIPVSEELYAREEKSGKAGTRVC